MSSPENSLSSAFAVFILTHGRPDSVITYNTLRKCGYTGRLYLIVDDEDKTVGRYIENFGRDRVIVFGKKEVADKFDEGNNFDDRRAAMMARNASFEIAISLGISRFVLLEDDYYYFGFRDLSGARIIKNMDSVFQACLKFFNSTNISSFSFAQGGDHIGGFCGIRSKRKAMNLFLCAPERRFSFVGTMNDDVNTFVTHGSRGLLFLTFTGLQLDQKDTQISSGGMSEFYIRFGTYCKSFTTVMMMPSSVRVAVMQSNNPRIHHQIDWKSTVPCIVREKHQKGPRLAQKLGATVEQLAQP